MHISCSKKLQLLAEFSAVSDSRYFITARKICEFIIEIISDSLWLMRNAKQETRAEKICRYIGNLNRGLAQYPELRSLRERKAEREAQLRAMPLEKRLELVPPEETERERKELIVTYTEIIADVEKELAEKQQAVREVKAQIAEFRRSRAKLKRQSPST